MFPNTSKARQENISCFPFYDQLYILLNGQSRPEEKVEYRKKKLFILKYCQNRMACVAHVSVIEMSFY